MQTITVLQISKSELEILLEKTLERFLQKEGTIKQELDAFLTVKETAEFLSLSVPTIYSLISKGEIPVMKRSKRCYFLKEDLLNYIKAGKKKTFNAVEKEIDSYLSVRGGTRRHGK